MAQTSTLPGNNADPGNTEKFEPEKPQSDLAHAAQRARDERERQRASRSENSQAVNEMAAELSELSEQGAAAPVGYRYYNFKQGDYSILVPSDAEVEGRDSYGLRLLSSEAMGSRTVVILGDPIPAEGDTPDAIFNNAANQYFDGCPVGIRHAGQPVNGRPATTPHGFSMCPLHREVLGYAQFVMGDGYVVPTVCGYPFAPEDLDPNPKRPIGVVVKKYDRESNGLRVCDVILPSLRFHEHGSEWKPKAPQVAHQAPRVPSALLSSNPSENTADTQENSLGNFARAHKKASSAEVLTELKHTAPGYSAYSFDYCSKEDCFAATLQVPVKARRDEQFRMDYVGLFEFTVPVGDTVAVIQATKGAPTKPGIISREEFIRTKVDWWIENVPAIYFSKAGNAEVFDEDLTTLSNMPARRLTFRSPTAFQPVITKLVAYMAPGVFVQVRCSVPEKAYADAQEMCEHVVNSLEVPKAKPEAEDSSAADDDDR